MTAGAVAGGSAAQAAEAPPAALSVEYLENPLGIDATSPRLEWQLQDTERGTRQTAYEVLVASSTANLEAQVGDLWDTGKVISSASTQVAYQGAELQSGTRYFWAVRVWDQDDAVSDWSDPAYFEMGLLEASDWDGSSWITGNGLMRTAFELDEAPTSARLYVSARGWWEHPGDGGICCGEVYGTASAIAVTSLNGERVGDHVLDPVTADTRVRAIYSTYDVTDQLTAGENVLGVQVGATSDIRAVLDADMPDGSTVRIASDGSWKTHAGPVTYADRFRGEDYDARLAQPAWDTPSFDASEWFQTDVPTQIPDYSVEQRPIEHAAIGAAVTALDDVSCCKWSLPALVDGTLHSTTGLGTNGYHSGISTNPESAKWVQVDLGESRPLESIVLYPANPTDVAGELSVAYGYPVRFKIETSNDPLFATGVQTVVDRTGADVDKPGVRPQVFVLDSAADGRYIRVTATKLRGVQSAQYAFTLAELAVNPESSSTASSARTDDGWSIWQLHDAVTDSISDARGHSSALSATPDTSEWAQIDLGGVKPVGRVTLWPAAVVGDGNGFPLRYSIAVSTDPDFSEGSTTVVDRTGSPQVDPGTAPVSFEFDALDARYIRVTATELGGLDDGTFALALSEISAAAPSEATVMSALMQEPARIVATHESESITKLGEGDFVVDFGQNRTGSAEITASGLSGQVVSLQYGEILDAKGHVSTANLSGPRFQQDRLTLDGGSTSWAPDYVYHGFRYVEVTGYPGELEPDDITALEMHNDVAHTGTFDSSNTFLNEFADAVRQTQLNNMHHVPEDTPAREKRGWMADAHIAVEHAIDTLDMGAFYTKWTRDMRDAQTDTGLVPDFLPIETGFDTNGDPAWSVGTVLTPWYMYERYGDVRVLAEQYETMTAWLDWVTASSVTNHIVDHPTQAWGNDWLGRENTSSALFRTAFYYQAAHLIAKTALILERPDDAARYTAMASEIKTAFNAEFLVPAEQITSNAAFSKPVSYGKFGENPYETAVNCCGWSLSGLTDGQAPPQNGFGFHSKEGIADDDLDPRWVQVDLGEKAAIHTVVLAPADPSGLSSPGFGYPVRFRIEVSNDPEFASGVTTVVDRTTEDQVNPGATRQEFAFEAVDARYVRVVATKLFQRVPGNNLFALSELEVNPGETITEIPSRYHGAGDTGQFTQLGQSIPLVFDMVPEEAIDDVVKSLELALEKQGGKAAGGVIGIKYTADALAKYDRDGLVFDALTATGPQTWVNMLENGPGTIWEDWNGAQSRDHIALGAIGQWLYEGLAGIEPDTSAQGYARSIVEPYVPEDLERASASVATPYGELSSAWEITDNGLTMTVRVPANTTSTIVVPTLGLDKAFIRENGKLVWNSNEGIEHDHVSMIGPQGDGIAFAVDSGTYTFTIADSPAISSTEH